MGFVMGTDSTGNNCTLRIPLAPLPQHRQTEKSQHIPALVLPLMVPPPDRQISNGVAYEHTINKLILSRSPRERLQASATLKAKVDTNSR